MTQNASSKNVKRIRSVILSAFLMGISAPMPVAAQGGASAQAPPPTPVQVDAVRMERVQQRRLVTGDLRAAKRSMIASRESGIVIAYDVQEGEHVEADQVIARLDDRRLELQIDQLAADRAVAIATRDERQAQLEWNEADEALVRSAYEGGASKPKELLDAEAETRISRARLEEAKRAIEVIDARRAIIEQRIVDTLIRSPFGGTVISTRTELGEWVAEGAPVVELLATDIVEAWLNVPQEQFGFLAGRDPALSVYVEATGMTMESRGVRILPMIDDRARSFTAIVPFRNGDGILAPGMSVTAWVPTDVESDRLTVSKSALMRDDAGSYGYAVRQMNPDGPPAVLPARFEILFPVGDRFVIESRDLRPGDLVVIEGNERLFPTAPVRIVESSSAPQKEER